MKVGTRISRTRAQLATHYLLAALMVALASVLRGWLLRHVGPMPTFVTYYPAVLLVASIGGGGPGVVATVLSALAADYWFIPPYGEFITNSPPDNVALGIFTGTCLFLSLLAERLRRARWAEAVNVALSHQNETLAEQSEELTQQSEELARQNEELQAQSEELQAQSEEIQALNAELARREELLQKLLDAACQASAEQAVMRDICASAREMFGEPSTVVVVGEEQAGRLIIRATAGLPDDSPVPEWQETEHSFAELVIRQNRTACLNDASLRPDLSILQVRGKAPFQAMLCAPLQVAGQTSGVVCVYSWQKREWTAEQFRMAEWLATQCAHILETLRLQNQLRRQAALIDLSPDSIIVRQLDATITFWSQGAQALYGWAAQEAVGRQTHTLLKTQFPQPREQIVQQVRQTGHWSGELIHRTKDGGQVVVQSRWLAQSDDQGKVTEILESNVDLTERKRAEDQLRETRDYLENLFNYANAPIVVWDPQFRITRFNQAFERLTGRSAGDVIGQPLDILFPADRRDEAMGHIRRALAGERWEVVEIPIQRDDGAVRVVLWNSATLYASDGETPVATIAQGQDITERIEAEETLRKLSRAIEQSPASVVITNTEGAIEYVNPQFTRSTGYTFEEALGKNPRVLKTEFTPPETYVQLWKTLKAGGEWHGEFCNRKKNGDLYWESASISPILDAAGRTTHFVAVKIETTDRKRAEEDLLQTAEDLRRSNKDLEQFAYVSSHDLQEPLRMVSSFAGILRDRYADKLDENGKEYFGFVIEGAHRMQALVNGLLQYSRIGTRAKPPERTNVQQAVDEALANLRTSIEESGARVTMDPLPTIRAERTQITQLFQNLIGNALKFRSDRQPEIHVSARKEAGSWLFSVKDNGIGIDPEFTDKIFVIFQRLHTRDKYPGTGIGLAICKKIVERHGGQVSVESQPGEGATFLFTLPDVRDAREP